MADSDQSQGAKEELKPESQERLAEMHASDKILLERSKTVDDRLEKIIHPTTGETQSEPTPSSEQKQTEEATPQLEPAKADAPDAEQPTLPATDKEAALANSKNPERTREYIDKLEAELKTYRDDRKKAAGDSVFDSLRLPVQQQPETQQLPYNFNLTQPQVQQIAQNYINADGTVDIDGLNNALKGATQRAQAAELVAAHAQRVAQEANEAQQVREAHTNFPQLDPKSDTFDPNFYDLVAVTLAKNGLKMSLNDAAKEVSKRYSPPVPVNLDKVKDEAVTAYKDSQAKRDQGPIETSKGEPRAESLTPKDPYKRSNVMDDPDIEDRLRKLKIIQ